MELSRGWEQFGEQIGWRCYFVGGGGEESNAIIDRDNYTMFVFPCCVLVRSRI